MLDPKIASFPEQDQPEFPVQEGQPRGAESPKKRIGFYEEDLHEPRLFSSDWRS